MVKSGQSLVEYGLFGALLIALPLLALQLFGNSLSSFFYGQSNTLQNKSTLSLLSTPKNSDLSGLQAGSDSQAGNPLNLKGGGFFTVVKNAKTGQFMLKQVDANGGVTNVTSVAGDQFNTLGTLRIARQLDALAQQQTDPALQNYYARLAQQAYYMGAAEGELDDVPGLSIYSKLAHYQYTNGDGLQEVVDRNRELMALMQNPPAGFDNEAFNQVMPLAAEVFNIGQNYLNHMSNFLDAKGNVPNNFGNNVAGDPYTGSGNGTAGSNIAMADNMGKATPIIGTHYADFVPYDTLKANVAHLLDTNAIKPAPVKITLTDAKTIDQSASAQQPQ
jgi:hypothetical protein